jgi:hypothetical protein
MLDARKWPSGLLRSTGLFHCPRAIERTLLRSVAIPVLITR